MTQLKQQQQVVVDISPAGNVVFDAQGFQGCGCAEATQAMVVLLGGGVQQEKPEFGMPPLSTGQTSKLTF